jgi:hypothetical protein
MVTLDTALFIVGLVMEATVLGLLLFRRIYKSLPIFSLYLAWSIINDVGVFFLIRHFPNNGLRIYLVSSAVDALLMFSILIEISMSVLGPIRRSLPRWTVLEVGALVLCLCGVVWLFTKPTGYADVPLKQLIVHMQMTTATVRVLFFVALAALSQFLSLGWRDRELQIATGFGIYSLASLLVELTYQNPALLSSPTIAQFHRLEQIASTSYVLSLLYWTFSFVQAEAERREFTPQMHNLLLALAGNARDTRISMARSSSKSKSDPRFRR